MPKGENSDAPERVYLDPNRPELGWAATPSRRVPGDVAFVRETPARAAAEQMLEALKGCAAAYDEICQTGACSYIEDEEDAAFEAARAAIAEAEPNR